MKTEERLYAITIMPGPGGKTIGSTSRTPVVCTTVERAKEIVETNEGDICEGYYMLAVIEPFIANKVYGYLLETFWYEWNELEKRYLRIECPDRYKSTVGFGIG